MSGSRKIIAWDSTIFIAWFQNEQDKPLDTIRLVLQDIAAGRVALLLSAVTLTEVLDEPLAPKAKEKFRQFTHRSNVEVAVVDRKIAELAAEFRERNRLARAKATREKLPKLKTPDAIIAATAAHYQADVLHAFDPDLLSHSESPIINNLLVTIPKTWEGQKSLYSLPATPHDYSDHDDKPARKVASNRPLAPKARRPKSAKKKAKKK